MSHKISPSDILFVRLGMGDLDACNDGSDLYLEARVDGRTVYYKITPVETTAVEYADAYDRAYKRSEEL